MILSFLNPTSKATTEDQSVIVGSGSPKTLVHLALHMP